MPTVYNWVISQLNTAPSENGLTNVVKTIHWRYQATNETHTADVYGSAGLKDADAENFVSYENLTQEKVISWLESQMDVESMKTNLNGQLERLANPPIVTLPFPWNSANNSQI